jgi:hypothetical protein
MSFALTPEHIEYKDQVARVGQAPVYEVKTTGGLYMHILAKDGAFDIVGTGSHRAISRYIMEKKLGKGKVTWTELSKSDWIPYECIDPQLFVKYEQVTAEYADAFRKHQGIE